MSRSATAALCVAGLVGATVLSQTLRPAPPAFALASPVTIPFELVTGHIVLAARVNDSPPLSLLLDTGDKFALIDLELARQMRVPLGQEVTVVGIGEATDRGAFVREGTTFTLAGFPGFSQAVTLAIPLTRLAPKIGHPVAGIIGADFIGRFVVEVDYRARVIRLHDRDTFVYSGPGQSVAMRLDGQGHPVIDGSVTPRGGHALAGRFIVDVGSNGSIALSSPFVAANGLPGKGVPTLAAIGISGTGGSASGRMGRLDALAIGGYTLANPVAMFSEDKAGAYARSDVQANIGQQVLGRFKLFLDYHRKRIIFEPATTLDAAFDRGFSGLDLEAEGADFRTIRVRAVRDGSPAAEAGLRENDVIADVDGRLGAGATLTAMLELLERPVAQTLTVRRGTETLSVTLTPKAVP